MPISRYQIRNVYSLADPELYKAADKDDPEALLEGVAMAGLVGVLRQLGDLAEFAAEIFHDLHEEVMATAARGHGLLVRAQQLELEIPSIERAFLSQTCHSPFFPNSGVDWHPNRQTTQNLITRGYLPRFVMDSYEDCRGPPRLFLLDKFDVGGAGACLKRYTDPSFYKVEASSYEIGSAETQKDKKIRRTKNMSRLKGGGTPEVSQTSHVKLHQLFLEELVQTGAVEPARRVKLKKRPNKFAFELESRESYMNKFLNSSLEDKLVHEVPICLALTSDNSNGSRLEILDNSMLGSALGPATLSRSPCVASSSVEKTTCGELTSRLEILEDRMLGSALGSAMQSRSPCVASSSVEETICGDPTSRLEILEDSLVGSALGSAMRSRSPHAASSSVEETICGDLADNLSAERKTSELPSSVEEEEVDEKQIAVDEEIKTCGLQNGYLSDDVASETDNYVDALGTMESQVETDAELRAKSDPSMDKGIYSDSNMDQLRSQSPGSQLIGNLTVSNYGIHSPRKGITNYLYSETTSTTNENTSSVGVVSPPRPFACTEIPFHPRAPPKQVSSIDENIPVLAHSDICVDVVKVPDASSAIDSALLVDQEAILEEGTSKEADSYEVSSNLEENLTSTRKKEEHGTVLEVNVDGLSTFSFLRNSEGGVDDKRLNDTIHRISENMLSQVEECAANNNNSTGSVHSQCSSPDSVISPADEQPFGPSLAERGIHDLDAEAGETNDIPVAKVTADNPPEIYPFPEEQLKEIGYDNALHISDSAEAIVVSYSSKDDETEELNDTKIQHATGAVSLADANRSGRNDGSVLKDEDAKLEEREIESCNSEVRIGGSSICIPDDADRKEEGMDLSTLEDDAELERREADSVNSKLKKSADVLLAVDADTSEDDGCLEPDVQSEMSQLCIVQGSKESGEKEEEDELLVISPDSDYVPCDDDSSNKLLFDSIPDASLACDDLNESPPSLNSKFLQEQTHSFLAETEDQNGLQQVVLCQPGDIAPCDDLSNVRLLDSAPDSTMFTEADHDHGDHIDAFEAAESSPLEDKVDRPNDQPHLASQLNFPTNVDHETHYDNDAHFKPSYPVNLASQSAVLQEEDLQQKPTVELLQASIHDINLSDQVRHQSVPVFPGLGVLPQSAPVKLEDMPPLPPLPPMQWRMRKLSNASTPICDGEHSRTYFPPIFQSKADEGPQVMGISTLDEIRNSDTQNQKSLQGGYEELTGDMGISTLDEIRNSDTQNQKSQQGGYEELTGDMGSFSQMVLPEASLHTEDHVKSCASSEAKFAENLVPQATIKTEHSHAAPTNSGQEIFWKSANPYSTSAVEMPTSIRPMKIPPPHSPLIDAVDAHDKSSASLEADDADGSFSRMVLPENSFKTEDHVKSSSSSEAEFAENLVPQAAIETEHSCSFPTTSGQEINWPSSNLYSIPPADEMPTSIQPMKIQRPRSPLIDAVAAHDKSKLRKVSERAMPQIPKGEEIDNLLEQIRAKSFNLKPAVQTRPSIQGPVTNLRVAALLEKANAIRQAFVGSDDDDDDSDSWSDS